MRENPPPPHQGTAAAAESWTRGRWRWGRDGSQCHVDSIRHTRATWQRAEEGLWRARPDVISHRVSARRAANNSSKLTQQMEAVALRRIGVTVLHIAPGPPHWCNRTAAPSASRRATKAVSPRCPLCPAPCSAHILSPCRSRRFSRRSGACCWGCLSSTALVSTGG